MKETDIRISVGGREESVGSGSTREERPEAGALGYDECC